MAKKGKNPIKQNKKLVCANLKTLRCYLELSKTELGQKTGIGTRAMEFENGRNSPTMEELQKIANLAEIPVQWIYTHRIYLSLNIV